MATMIKCDVCGIEEETDGVMLPNPLTGPLPIPFLRPRLPEGWRRTGVPMPDGERREKELCPADVKTLWALFGIAPQAEPDECVRCGHPAGSHKGAAGCVERGGACSCELSEAEATDPGWAEERDED